MENPAWPLAITYNTAEPAIPPKTWTNDVRQQFRRGKTPADAQPDGYRGIQVAAGNVADGVGHRQHRQAEGQRHADEPDAQVDGRRAFGGDEFGSQHSAAAAAKNEPKGSKKFREKFVFHFLIGNYSAINDGFDEKRQSYFHVCRGALIFRFHLAIGRSGWTSIARRRAGGAGVQVRELGRQIGCCRQNC